jgi:hypothetical protein
MNMMSTAELRRIEVEQDRSGQQKWYHRIEDFWKNLADVFSPKVAASPRWTDTQPIMSIGDD